MTEPWTQPPPRREPDFDNLLKVLARKRPTRPTLFEFFLNLPLYERLSGVRLEPGVVDREVQMRAVLKSFWRAGYDYATIHASTFGFPVESRPHAQTASMNEGFVITDWDSFERYPWQSPSDFDYDILERLRPEMPDGLKLIVPGPGGVLENLVSLVGYDNVCYLLVDNPKLLQAVADAIGSRMIEHYRIVLGYDTVGAIIGNDDWGFKTQPMLPPDSMRQYILPWHKRIAQVAHDAGRPAILHSCGNLSLLMDDVIDDIGYDGKHSYEDAIMPVEEAYRVYGRRIAILGGLDVDFVVRSAPAKVRQRALDMLEQAAEQGSYALGTGNSVPAYVPDDNYFAMISAAFA